MTEGPLVGVGSSRLQQSPGRTAGQERCRYLLLIHDLGRNADINDPHRADEISTGMKQESALQQRHGYGKIRLDRPAHDRSRIRINPGRDVNGNYRAARGIDHIYGAGVQALERGGQADTEQRVHHDIAPGKNSRKSFLRGILDDVHIHLPQDGEIHLCFTLDSAERRQQSYPDGYPPDAQTPGKREAVAAVVALSADNGHAGSAKAVEEPLHLNHDAGCGVLHKDRTGNAELPDGPAVDVLHFLCGGDLHNNIPI